MKPAPGLRFGSPSPFSRGIVTDCRGRAIGSRSTARHVSKPAVLRYYSGHDRRGCSVRVCVFACQRRLGWRLSILLIVILPGADA